MTGFRAVLAADTWKVLIMRGIIDNIVRSDILPYVFGSPRSQRIKFHESEFRIVFDFLRVGTCRRLIAANARNPCLVLDRIELRAPLYEVAA